MEPINSSLIAVVGPTGSGKSALALAIARFFDGEIVNFDSVQVYRRLQIGAAKTPLAERNGVRHHLLDVIEPTAEMTAGVFAVEAERALREVSARGKLPVLAGGTGFYLRSLLDGLSPAPVRNPELRERLSAIAVRKPQALHRFLRRISPLAAQRIHANDVQKLIRAIELSAAEPPGPRRALTGFRVLKIGLDPPRAELYQRINQRTVRMFDCGLLEETKALLDSGVPAAAKAMQSLGYKQAVAVIEQRMSLADAIVDVQTKTRQYAKRQMTWFRRESDIKWIPCEGNSRAAWERAREFTTEFLSGNARW